MKNVFGRIIAAIPLASALVLGACTAGSNGTNGFQEKGSVQVLVPLSNSSGSYSLEIFILQGIEDLQTVAGKFVRFFMSPSMVDDKLHGSPPKARFIKNTDGAYIPTDDLSQQLVTVYAHMQRMALLDEELGIGDVNKWPRDVGVAVRVRGGVVNNAFYDGKSDSMLFVPYAGPGLAISRNGGILAHEHFHSLFCKRAICSTIAQIHNRADFVDEEEIKNAEEKKLAPDPHGEYLSQRELRHYYHMALFRGMNEGLADYWGWMYTGNPDFIALSLPGEKKLRSLHVDDVKTIKGLPSEESIKNALAFFYGVKNKNEEHKKQKFEENVTGYAYTLGTQFSRAMKRFSDIYAESRNIDELKARREVAHILVNLLPDIKSDYEKNPEKFYNTTLFLKSFLKYVDKMQHDECDFLAQLFNNSSSAADIIYSCKDDSGWKIVEEVTKPAESEKDDHHKDDEKAVIILDEDKEKESSDKSSNSENEIDQDKKSEEKILIPESGT